MYSGKVIRYITILIKCNNTVYIMRMVLFCQISKISDVGLSFNIDIGILNCFVELKTPLVNCSVVPNYQI